MPVVKGRVGEKTVDVLRDTGCSGVVVKKDLVDEDQFTEDFKVMLLIDNTARKVPIARIYDPYLKGHVEAQCLSDPIYDLIIGNVHDARDAQNADPCWQEACAVTTRSQAKKKGERTTLKVSSARENPIVDREKLKQMQREDESLRKYWDRDGVLVKGQAEISFEENSGVMYRRYRCNTLKFAHSELEKAQQKGKHYYDLESKVRKFESGEKVLILLPTDHNKLLMQWKGPFEVSSVVGLNDYKVKVKGKEKVYHPNLLNKYFEREETISEGAVAGGVGATCVDDAVNRAAKADEAEGENVDFLELGGYVAKESIKDVKTGPNLTDEQRNEFMDLAKQFTNLFTEAPGATDLVQHHIKLLSGQAG